MQTFAAGPTSPSSVHGHDIAEPFLDVSGVAGSILRATPSGLTVCPCDTIGPDRGAGHRHWSYAELGDVRVDSDGTVGVIRATIRSTGTALPLLLLEPSQIGAARRSLEIVWNLMGLTRTAALTA